ncbi:MAG: hypothetical protein QF752_04570 [Planctomycetota bacterium]|nr:hypothetical protein [Planctomycetota bacterium]
MMSIWTPVLFGLTGLLLFSGCSGRPSFPTVGQLAEAGQLPPDADRNQLSDGRIIMLTQCHGCHRIYRPAEYKPEQWPSISRRMGKLTKFSREETDCLRAYSVLTSRWLRTPIPPEPPVPSEQK